MKRVMKNRLLFWLNMVFKNWSKLGFNEQVAQKTVKKYPFTNNLEELINKALEMSDTSKKFTEQKISLI